MNTVSELTLKAESYARNFAEMHIAKSHLFHSISHFEHVVDTASMLAREYQLDSDPTENILVAMWFHDLGYDQGWKEHEDRSIEIATRFLESEDQPEEKIKAIARLINVTKSNVNPENLHEEIVCDADSSHIGSKKYTDFLGRLRGEWETHQEKVYTEDKWLKLNIGFLNSHSFYTSIAYNKFGDRKRKNILKLQKKLGNLMEVRKSNLEHPVEESEINFTKKADRGVETMFRVTLRNHNNLSQIADNKANIMLSINAIMLSIIVSTLVPTAHATPNLLVPTIILISVCMVSIILAILSIRPKITSVKYSDEAFKNKKYNILFFGNFYQLPIEKFEWGIRYLMEDEDLLYSSLSKDLYYLGLVLAKKYKHLNVCYNVFMVGLLIAAASFIISLSLG